MFVSLYEQEIEQTKERIFLIKKELDDIYKEGNVTLNIGYLRSLMIRSIVLKHELISERQKLDKFISLAESSGYVTVKKLGGI